MAEKAINERVMNFLLLLYLIEAVNKFGRIEDDLKAQKLVFLTEKLFVQRKLKGFNYNFFRWHRGPYCAHLSEDIRVLIDCGMLKKSDSGIQLTEEALNILEHCRGLLAGQSAFISPIESVAKDYGVLLPDDIKEKVYDMKIFVPKLRKVMKIRDIKEGQLILFNLSEKNAREVFTLDENWQATLELVFNKEALDSLRAAQQDAVEGRTCDFDAI